MKAEETPPPISRIGRYEILGTLARGGMATVYLARLASLGGFSREFALKVIHPHLAEQNGFRERLLEEARLASRVRHPNAVTMIDSGEDQGYAYLVLELIDGVNLRQLMLHRSHPFSPAIAAAIVAQVSRGLHALHIAKSEDGTPLGVVHRDLSPHNVMLDRDGRAILIDLGLAKAEGREDITQVGVLAGKVPYMSPEQARLETLDARSDVFAMGIVLYQLATNEMPFGDSVSLPTLERLQRCELDRVHEGIERHQLPKWFAEVVLSCLRADPGERIQTAEELSEVIEQELLHSGHDEASIRRTLMSLCEDAAHSLGNRVHEEPALAPIMAIAARSRRFAFAARWAAMGGVMATLGMAGVWIGSSSADPETIPAAAIETAREGGSLAADGVPASRDPLPTARRRFARSRPEAQAPDAVRALPNAAAIEMLAPQLTLVEMLEPDEDAPGVQGPDRPRRRRATAELKPNPYAQ
jgi:serine/threonine-protein kinase